MKIIPHGKSLIVLVGPSGAGKSHFSKEHFSPWEIVSTDEIRREICGGDLIRQDKNELVFEEFEHRINLRLRANQRVVADATHIRNRDRRRTAEIGRLMNVPVVYVVINRDGVIKHKHGGWRTEIVNQGKTLIDRHEETFVANEAEILNGDRGLATEVVDTRVDEFMVASPLPRDPHAILPFLLDRGFEFVRLIGDVHGNLPGMTQALAGVDDRGVTFPIFLGDVVDYGVDTLACADMAWSLVSRGEAAMIRGNHERKIARFVETERAAGWQGIATHGNNVTINQLKAMNPSDRVAWEERFLGLVEASPDWIQIGDRLILTHGAVHPRMWNNPLFRAPRASSLESHALYGQTTGEKDEKTGFPVRKYDWVEELPFGSIAVVGHAVRSVESPFLQRGEAGGTAVFLDTGSSKVIEEQGPGHLSWMNMAIRETKRGPRLSDDITVFDRES